MPKAVSTDTTVAAPMISGATALALAATVDRLKHIAGEAMDRLYLSDGPPHPDYELLDVCGDTLHLMKQYKTLRQRGRTLFGEEFSNLPQVEQDHRRAQADEIRTEVRAVDGRISSLLSQARKLPATTAAGVYAKVLVIRASETGAARLAKTLADDLVNVPTLRGSIWPDEGGVA